MQPWQAIYYVWDLWAVSWLIAALWSARTESRPALGRGLFYYIPVIAGGALLFYGPARATWIWSEAFGKALGWTCVSIVAAGLLFCWWARIHLGRLWSGTVTRKEGHHVVDTGPYRLVRHPIYTGIIVACFATALEKTTALTFAGAAIMALGWYMKARVEERFLRDELGAASYDAYAARVPMLVPFAR
ncbi:MAG: isoprenylcysteine carboxylmethyltransferase family protein [Alphaproteobacteria bacterium]|nr:isoprenylcysteine carboxylmethyltransferase family protein [Alphaproteobacteria bacterium]